MRELTVFSHETREPLSRLVLTDEGEVYGDHSSLPLFKNRKTASPNSSNEEIFDNLHGYSNGYVGMREKGKDHPQFPLPGGKYEQLPQNREILQLRLNRSKSMNPDISKAASTEEQDNDKQKS